MPLVVEKKLVIKKEGQEKSRIKANADWRGKYVSSWRRAAGTAQDWLRIGLELTADELDKALAGFAQAGALARAGDKTFGVVIML